MNAADALNAARATGIRVSIDHGDLLLEASVQPPQHVLQLLSRHKARIVTLLRPAVDGWSGEDWLAFFDERAGHFEFDCGLARTKAETQAFECCIVEWLNRHPAPSPTGRCARCGNPETHDAVVLPYGVEAETCTWLHSDCWRPWHEHRRAQAADALRRIGIAAAGSGRAAV